MHNVPLNAEVVFKIGNLPITNSIVATWLVMVILLVMGFVVRAGIKNNYQGAAGGFASLFEFVVDTIEDILGWPATKALLPILGTFFIFILTANWIGLVPGFSSILITNPAGEAVPLLRAAATDLNTTLALAILSVFFIQVWGLRQQSLGYMTKYFNFTGPWYLKPINFFVGILEIVSELAKVLSFGFRLFGNVFAGEVLLTIMFGLVPLVVPGIFYGLEFFVGFIQAFVFVMLSAVFLKMAGEAHGEEHE